MESTICHEIGWQFSCNCFDKVRILHMFYLAGGFLLLFWNYISQLLMKKGENLNLLI